MRRLLVLLFLTLAVSARVTALPVEEATVADIQAAYLRGETTAAEVTAAYLARIAAYDQRGPHINSIINLNPKALDEARALDAQLAATGKLSGPLHGIPVLVKDCIDAMGMPATAGFQGWKNFYPLSDATLITKIKSAGGIILGKASLSEFTNGGGDNINSVLGGYARNPYNTAFATGGSSGGTGASIAANFAVLGIGTDTGGSIRMPAAHNALVGLRPTHGLVSLSGVLPNSSTRDTAGPMTRTVTEAALLLETIAGVDPADPISQKAEGHIAPSYTAGLKKDALKGARLGVLRQGFKPAVTDPRILAHFEQTIAELKAAGAEIIDPFVVPEIDAFPRTTTRTQGIAKADMIKFLNARPGIPYPTPEAMAESKLAHPFHQSGLESKAKADATSPYTDPVYLKAVAAEDALRAGFMREMAAAKVDAIVLPVWAQLPVVNGDRNTQLMTDTPDPKGGVTGLSASLTSFGSNLQWPALSVPSGYIGESLPQGLQILGRAWDEARLLAYAYAYEQATHYRRPPASVPPLTPAK